MSSSKPASGSSKPVPSTQEIQQQYNRYQNEIQALATKIGELEQEAEEHSLVISTLNEAVTEEPDRKCFRMVGGILVERTVQDVLPALKTTLDGIAKFVANLAEQYKSKEEEFENFKREYKIRPASAS